MNKLGLVKQFRMEQENEHLAAYKRVFPQAQPTIFQMELIESTVTDAQAWSATLIFWGGNDYRAESIFKMLEYYKETLGKRKFVGTATEVSCQRCMDSGEVSQPKPGGQYDWEMEFVPCDHAKT